MNENGADHGEERLVELLVEYDEALARDAPTERIDDTAAELDPKLAQEWAAAKSCLDLLERMRHEGTLQQALPQPTKLSPTTQPAGQRRVGRFILEHELGRGGLGIVYLAHDPQLGRKVALKIPRFEALLDEDLRQRFLFEAEAAARLNHPHIVALYEVGEEGSVCYLAAEYCAGPTLSEWLRKQPEPVSFAAAAKIVSQLADAVDHAHSRGVLHRDIKPSNVLLTAQSDNGSLDSLGLPKLTDFGMAKLLEQGGDARTRTGAILGTLAYMAPEQIEGRIRDLDVRTDVYALGAILYELLTGHAPYSGSTDVDLLRQVATSEPTAPRKKRPDTPRDLESITLKCLAKQPDARYASARALADDLQHFLEGKPTVARPLGVAGRVVKWIRRRPAVTALALVSILSIAGMVGFNAWRIQEASRSQAESIRLQKLADAERDRAASKDAISRRMQYISRMRKAQQAWRDGNLTLLQGILAEYTEGTPDASLRHFEWYHLNYLAHLPHRILRGHQGEAYGLAFAPDGRSIVTGGEDGTVRLWDVASGNLLATFREHRSCVNSINFSPDGDTFVTASCDKTIKLWSLSQRKVLATLTGHTREVSGCVFLGDGQTLLSLSDDTGDAQGLCEARVWDVSTGSMRSDWPPAGESIVSLAATRTGNTFVTITGNQATVWKRQGATWKKSGQFNFIGPSQSIALTPDEERLLVPDWPRYLRIYRLRDGALENELNDIASGVTGIAFAPTGDSLATASTDGSVRVIDFPSGKVKQVLLGHTGRAWQVAWSPSGDSLASSGSDGTVRIWDLQRGSAPQHLKLPVERQRPNDQLWDFAYLRDGEHISASYASQRLTWNLQTGQSESPQQTVSQNASRSTQSNAIEPFPGASQITLQDWDPLACHILCRHSRRVTEPPTRTINCTRILADGTQIVEFAAGKLQRWSVNPLRLIGEHNFEPSPVPDVVYDISLDGRRLCAAQTNGQVTIRDLDRVKPLNLGKNVRARDAVFSPAGDRVLVLATDGILEFDADTGQLNHDYSYVEGNIGAATASYSADGQRIAIAFNLGYIAIHDAVTGEEMLRLSGSSYAVVFAKDGKSLLANNASDGGLLYWPGSK